MKIEYWSDFVCPYCYIGKKRLQTVIEEFHPAEEVRIQMKSYELDRHAPFRVRYTAEELFALKYRLDLKTAHDKVAEISRLGEQEGLEGMDYARTRVTNTFDAHRLAKYAASQGNHDLEDLLYKACFCEHENIGEKDVLLRLGEQSGLDPAGTEQILSSDAYGEAVRADEREAHLRGIRLVPHFVVDGREVLSGAESREKIREIIQKCYKNI